jgi:hypothetical protein
MPTTSAAITTSDSSLASIIYDLGERKEWERLSDSSRVAYLHTELWGIPIALVDSSPVEQGTPSDRMDESSDNNTDKSEDDDIIEGCCVLHFASDHCCT